MSKFKVSIKTQTLRYTTNNGYNIVAHPIKESQLNSMLMVKYVYFFGCGDYKLSPTINHSREGEIIRADAKKLYEWISTEQSKYFPNNSMIVYPKGFSDPWLNIPIGHKATKDWLKKTGHIKNKNDIEHLRHMGNSKFNSYNGAVFKNYKKKIDTNVMSKKGTIGEEIIKRYFLSQPGVNEVISSGDVYAKWDLEIDYVRT